MLERAQDRPLHADIRRLASTLGRVIRRLEGEQAFLAVEELRRACVARRRGETGAPSLAAVLEEVVRLPLPTLATVARAFALFFLLVNTAEQVHRVRRRRDYLRRSDAPPQPASLRWTIERLRERGLDASHAAELLARLSVRPVLTAHPTESARRTTLGLQVRVADLLLAIDQACEPDGRKLEEQLEAEVELLWLSSEVRRDRPSVLDEASSAIWYLEHRLWPAAAAVSVGLARAYEEVFQRPLEPIQPLRAGSWVGGDRDGNPYVTPPITLAACRRAAYALAGAYARQLEDLVGKLALSTRIKAAPQALADSLKRDRAELPKIWQENKRSDSDELVRLKLAFMRARLEERRRQLAASDAGRSEDHPAAYRQVEELEHDLELVRQALLAAGAEEAERTMLAPLRAQVAAFGLHGYEMDVRQDAAVNRAALEDIAQALDEPAFDRQRLQRELTGRRPLVGARLNLTARARDALEVFRTMRRVQDELGPTATQTYIISMTHSAEDLLGALLLGQECGLADLAVASPWSRFDIVPLFETWAALQHADSIMRDLYRDPVYRQQLQARGMSQQIMLGYSDSAKDAGVLAAAWALYRAQEALLRESQAAGVTLTLFHGQGGTVGRGGGSPVYRALTALPPGSLEGGIKITEQGEVVSQKYGLLPIAERSLEVMISGTVMAMTQDWRVALGAGEEQLFRATMERLAATAFEHFRGTAYRNERLFRLLLQVTPLEELAHVHYGSRPTFRAGQANTLQGIRAIPWVFGWTQIRLILPGWLGVGTALDAVLAEPRGLELLQRMAAAWPFFDDFLAKVEMVCAKVDLEIARLYVEQLSSDHRLFDELAAEYVRTVRAVLAVRGAARLLEGNPLLDATLALRNPYVDPLNLVQVALLRRKREGASSDPLLDEILGSTLNGIAQGLRNTG